MLGRFNLNTIAMTADIQKDLEMHGWHLSQEGIDICKEEIKTTHNKPVKWQDIEKAALNLDLGDIGEKFFTEEFTKEKRSEFTGPCVLQVVKVRNISAPKANEQSSGAPRMLHIHLTDGHRTYIAIENEKISSLNLEIAPGSKLCLKGKMATSYGTILLNSQNADLLGGRVDSLYNKWIAAKEASGYTRIIGESDDTPPPFVNFGKRITYKYKSNTPSLEKSDQTNDDAKEFNEQRQAAIAEVQKSKTDASGKVFSTGINKTTIPTNTSYHRRQPEKSEVYRDVATTSHKNPSLDENLCDQLVQMGFERQPASKALLASNNSLERALEHLVTSNDKPNVRETRSGDRADRGRRGGRGRNRRGRNDDDAGEEHRQSSNATLFDFLETKFAKQPAQKKSASSSGQNYRGPIRRNDGDNNNDDEQLQDEYIMEYVRELSLVETRGGGSDMEKGRQNKNPRDEGNRERRGKEGGRFDKSRDAPRFNDTSNTNKRNSFRGEGRGGRGRGQKYHSNRDSNDRRPNGYRGENEERFSRFESDLNANVTGQKRGKSYRNARGSRMDNGQPPVDWRDDVDEISRRGQDRLPPEQQLRDPGPGGNYHRSQRERQSDVPPRFRKNQPYQNKFPSEDQENHQRYERGNYNPESRQEKYPRSHPEQKRGLTLADTAKQIKPSETQPAKQSYQQPRNNGNRQSNHRMKENARVSGWKKGAHCKAKYWEDGQYHDAVVVDVHAELPYAVVEYLGYGNCEEVAFEDMTPANHEIAKHHVGGGDQIVTQEFRRRRGPNQGAQNKRAPNRPTQKLYELPSHKQPS
uniref:Survival of motor neuron-related-splicing factor 30 n=1 Tax=Phallusia mammillata TaxID=59560 RepID=A0A6F9DV42_9ASCI|nr:tudor domain-containing protein 3 [Phallusia mammillata]